MHPRHRLDLSVADVAHGLVGCLVARRTDQLTADVLHQAGVADDGLVTASVRSGWHLLLGAVDWPPGAEVLVSAVTHPDMTALITAAGLRPVPVEIDLGTLLPTVPALEAARTPRTRAVLVAQLFGGRADLTFLTRFTRRHGLLLVEDAAQAYAGPGSIPVGEPDVTLVSFGLIKTATAVGGAVLRVRDPGLRAAMAATQRGWPVQSRRAYAGQLLRALALLALSRPPAYGVLFAGCRAVGRDPVAVINAATRSAVGRGTLDARFSMRPGAPLLALLRRRLGPSGRVRARTVAGERLADRLPERLRPPGRAVRRRTHWLFPVRSGDPDALVAALRQAGIDASASTSNLVALTSAGPSSDLMRRVVYLPAYPELPEGIRARLVRVLHEVESDPAVTLAARRAPGSESRAKERATS